MKFKFLELGCVFSFLSLKFFSQLWNVRVIWFRPVLPLQMHSRLSNAAAHPHCSILRCSWIINREKSMKEHYYNTQKKLIKENCNRKTKNFYKIKRRMKMRRGDHVMCRCAPSLCDRWNLLFSWCRRGRDLNEYDFNRMCYALRMRLKS